MKPIILMGVSDCGKSTIGRLLAEKTGGTFHDGDDFHPESNIEKMSRGIPLTDTDRQGWLQRLAHLIKEQENEKHLTIIACSALKKSYRQILHRADFIYLQGSKELLRQRLESRENHYMPADMLTSQLDTLEPPDDALTLDIQKSPEELVSAIMQALEFETR